MSEEGLSSSLQTLREAGFVPYAAVFILTDVSYEVSPTPRSYTRAV